MQPRVVQSSAQRLGPSPSSALGPPALRTCAKPAAFKKPTALAARDPERHTTRMMVSVGRPLVSRLWDALSQGTQIDPMICWKAPFTSSDATGGRTSRTTAPVASAARTSSSEASI